MNTKQLTVVVVSVLASIAWTKALCAESNDRSEKEEPSRSTSVAIDLDKDVWFLADFDGPMRINGSLLQQAPIEEGYVEGKFGRGYWFFPKACNRLPSPTLFLNEPNSFSGEGLQISGETVSFRGGAFKINERPSRLGWWWCPNEGLGIWSFEVRGKPGTKVTLAPGITPTPPNAAKRAMANKNIKNYSPETAQPDLFKTNTFTLAKDWQRVYAPFFLDRCTAESRKVWLDVDTTGPVEMRKFQYFATSDTPKKNPDPKPGLYLDGDRTLEGVAFKCTDPETLKTFPFQEGSCVCWVKNPEGADTNACVHAWGLRGEKSWIWGFFGRGAFFGTDHTNNLPTKVGVPRRSEWTHVAATWNKDRLAYFIDGKCVAEKKHDPTAKRPVVIDLQSSPLKFFAFGPDTVGRDVAMFDDFAILRRALSDDEIAALATANEALAAGASELVLSRPNFPIFPRNQRDAALLVEVHAQKAVEATLDVSVGTIEEKPRTVMIPAGKSFLKVPFDVSRQRAGDYDYVFALKGADGKILAKQAGMLTVQPRLEDNPFLFVNWGGGGQVTMELLHKAGLNCFNIDLNATDKIREVARHGDYVNVRYNNVRVSGSVGYEDAAVAQRTTDDFAALAGLDHWRTTLLNTEVYGMNQAREAMKIGSYAASVRKALGHEPDFNFRDAPLELIWPKGQKPAEGLMERTTYPALATISYVFNEGHPLFKSNRATTEAIHQVKDGVTVWSEPLWGGVAGSVDMGADWVYRLKSEESLVDLLRQYAACRRHGKPYMPTLDGSYWPQQWGEHPTLKDEKGKPKKVQMAQSADEAVVKAWMSISAVPAHNLSFFDLCAWDGNWLTNAYKFKADPKADIDCICEPGTAERFGAAWRKDLAPAAELLRDLTNVQAQVAFVTIPESHYAGGFGWLPAHYGIIQNGIAREAATFDCRNIDEPFEDLARYKYLIVTMNKAIFKDHAEKLRKLAERGVGIVQDSYATVHFPNEFLLKDARYLHAKWREMSEMALPWYASCRAELEACEPSISAGDGKTCHTFEKRYGGVRYIAVVNDLRVQEPTFANTFKTNNYHVVGAPQRIETTIRDVPKKAEIYLFNAQGRKFKQKRSGTTVTVTRDFAAAEGCVYVVVPCEYDDVKLVQEGEALVVTLLDDDGRPCVGRQVVELTLTDETGARRDESGRYVVENGRVRIPLFIADADRAGFASGRWRAHVVDLVSGEDSKKISVR